MRLAQRLLRITCPLAIVLGSPSLAKAENPCLSFPGDPDAPTEILNAPALAGRAASLRLN